MDAATIREMEPLEIRDRRYRLQQRIEALDEENDRAEIEALSEQIRTIQENCGHEHIEESKKESAWRCRDCDRQEAVEEEEVPEAGEGAAED